MTEQTLELEIKEIKNRNDLENLEVGDLVSVDFTMIIQQRLMVYAGLTDYENLVFIERRGSFSDEILIWQIDKRDIFFYPSRMCFDSGPLKYTICKAPSIDYQKKLKLLKQANCWEEN